MTVKEKVTAEEAPITDEPAFSITDHVIMSAIPTAPDFATVLDIAGATNLPQIEISASLKKLLDLGAVVMPRPERWSRSPALSHTVSPSAQRAAESSAPNTSPDAVERACELVLSTIPRVGTITPDKIRDRTLLPDAAIGEQLTLLELAGEIERWAGGRYCLAEKAGELAAASNGAAVPEPDDDASMLASDIAIRVLNVIPSVGARREDEICRLTGLSNRMVCQALSSLVSRGSIERWDDGGYHALKAPAHRNVTAPEPDAEPAPTKVREIELDRIQPSHLNTRSTFDPASLEELAASIKAHGLIEPIILRTIPKLKTKSNAGVLYEIIAGERRWRAAKIAGLTTITAILRGDVSDQDALEINLIENLVRKDINPLEEARGYQQLSDLGYKQKQIADLVHRSQPAVANTLRLLQLPADVRALIADGTLSVAHGTALASYHKFPEIASTLAHLAVEHKWASAELEGRAHKKFIDHINRCAGKKLLYSVGDRYGSAALFDTAVCKKCPYDAQRAGICMRPEHYLQLNREAQEAITARNAAALTRVKETPAVGVFDSRGETDGDPDVPLLASLSHDDYVNLTYFPAALGCSEKCECRRIAINAAGERVPICIDKERRRQLLADDEAAKNAARTAKAAELTQAVQDAIDAPVAGFRNAVILLATMNINRCDYEGVVAAAKRLSCDNIAEIFAAVSDQPVMPLLRDCYGALQNSDASEEEIASVVAEALCMRDIRLGFDGEYARGEAPTAEMLVCGKQTGDQQVGVLNATGHLTCRVCGEINPYDDEGNIADGTWPEEDLCSACVDSEEGAEG